MWGHPASSHQTPDLCVSQQHPVMLGLSRGQWVLVPTRPMAPFSPPSFPGITAPAPRCLAATSSPRLGAPAPSGVPAARKKQPLGTAALAQGRASGPAPSEHPCPSPEPVTPDIRPTRVSPPSSPPSPSSSSPKRGLQSACL